MLTSNTTAVCPLNLSTFGKVCWIHSVTGRLACFKCSQEILPMCGSRHNVSGYHQVVTQLVIIHKWSKHKMKSHIAKTTLKNGWTVTSVNHGAPNCVNFHSLLYITKNTSQILMRKRKYTASSANSRNISPRNAFTAPIVGSTKIQCMDRWWNQRHRNVIAEEELRYEVDTNANAS